MRGVIVWFLLGCTLMAAGAAEAAQKLGVLHRYDEALSRAKQEKKLLVMVVVKEGCRWCDKLVDRTLSDAKVRRRLEKHATVLIVDRDDPFPKAFHESFYPSIFYIDPVTVKSVYENIGYVGSKCFLNDLESAMQTYRTLYDTSDSVKPMRPKIK